MKVCCVIPFYNHGEAIGQVIASLRSFALPCFIVDDGSDAAAKIKLLRAIATERDVELLTRATNGGKGEAVIMGCEAAFAAGFTHALQIDADGQHRAGDVPVLLAAARAQPDAVISGQAIYDASVPHSRQYGRYITHVWVWINTLSLSIKDSMCGLRVYPLAAACKVWRRARIGRRMDFDVEIIVRLAWAGVDIVNVPTQVTYPVDGVSHFRMLRDNVLISCMHARLFCGMLVRLPLLLARRVARIASKVAA